MSERYLKLFSLEENLYIPGSPVLIAAGALLKDTQTGKILGQLKLQSISDQPIKAATVELIPLDTVGNPLGEPVSYQYLDLEITRDAYWGSQDPIRFSDPSTRAYTASVKEVIFSDNSIWTAQNSAWKALPAKTMLETQLDDFELATQYRMHFGMDCQYGYQTVEDLWYCPCGAVNHQGPGGTRLPRLPKRQQRAGWRGLGAVAGGSGRASCQKTCRGRGPRRRARTKTRREKGEAGGVQGPHPGLSAEPPFPPSCCDRAYSCCGYFYRRKSNNLPPGV